MAPESIARQVYSKKSDVWMFGILGMCEIFVKWSVYFDSNWWILKVYEIVARCEPYKDKDPMEVSAQIRFFKFHLHYVLIICLLVF
jgi:hypothetical protein